MTIASDSTALAADILNHADASGFPKWKKGSDLSSATGLTLGSDGNAFDITGTTAITSISTRGVGAIILLHFDGALTLTHHSTNLVLPDGENITTAAGDVAVLHEYASADWRLVSYSRADAASGVLSVANGGTGAATLTDGGVLLGSGTGAVTAMSVLSDGEMIVGDGTTDPVAESGATLRTSIGVGTGDSPQFTAVNVGAATDTTVARASAGDINVEGNLIYRAGGTDVPVADGGTGASTLTANAVLTGNGTSAIQAESDLLFASNKVNPTASAHDAAGTTLTVSAGATTAGTSNNQAGGALTLQGGQGKGSGAGGAIVFQVANEGSSGSSLNSLATALTVNDDSTLTTAGAIELGHASDTTIARSGSGDITIEGNAVYRAGGTDVPVADGGTGASTLTDGGVLLGSGTGAITAMAVLSDGNVVVGDGSTDPVALAAFTSSTGQLKHERGGIETDISGIAKGGLVAGSGTGSMAITTVGSEDQVLTVDGSGGIGWEDPAAGGMASLVADTTPQLGGFLDANGNFMQTEKGGDISSASPLVILTNGDYFDVTGTTNYAAMTVAADRQFTLQFDGALTMTHHATNLDLPGAANITTAAGDVATFQSTGANTVQCISYTKADGTAVVAASGGVDASGTPADGQVAIWTDADTLEGETGLTFDGSTLATDGNMQVPDDKGYVLGTSGDLVFTTNTSETYFIWNAGTARDLTSYGHAYMFTGGAGGVSAEQALYGGEGGTASFGINADQNDDAGDGWNFFALTDNDLKINNNNNEPAAILQWEGLLQLDSTLSQNAFDYAEFFEWKTPLADDDEAEAMLGMTVVLDGDKVRLAEVGEEDAILGVIRPNGVATTCNERIKWQAKYLKDVWGRFIYEDFTRTTWNEPDKSHRHSYPSDQIPAYRLKRDFSQDQPNWWLNEANFEKDKDGEFIPVVVPETDAEKEATDFLVRDYHRGSGKPLERRIFNPEFDQSREYEQRQDRRKEWAIVGLIGQVIIRQEAVLAPNYRFMKWTEEPSTTGLASYFIK